MEAQLPARESSSNRTADNQAPLGPCPLQNPLLVRRYGRDERNGGGYHLAGCGGQTGAPTATHECPPK
jgi:hypothetical protein